MLISELKETVVAGFVGGFFSGVFCDFDGAAAFGISNPGGAIAGNGRQVGLQLAGFCFIVGWNTVMTTIILLGIKYVLRVPLKMSDEQLMVGDDAIHGESAYSFEEVPMIRRTTDEESGEFLGKKREGSNVVEEVPEARDRTSASITEVNMN